MMKSKVEELKDLLNWYFDPENNLDNRGLTLFKIIEEQLWKNEYSDNKSKYDKLFCDLQSHTFEVQQLRERQLHSDLSYSIPATIKLLYNEVEKEYKETGVIHTSFHYGQALVRLLANGGYSPHDEKLPLIIEICKLMSKSGCELKSHTDLFIEKALGDNNGN